MRYLVTGGAGFIGSHLVERLLKEEGSEVIVIDDLSSGNIKNIPDTYRLSFHCYSILDDIQGYFRGVDTVFHLAALTRPQDSIKNAEKYNKVNVEGTLKVFLHAKKFKVRRIVFVSSSSAYGEQKTYPTPETAPLNPMCPYALQKMFGEQYAKLLEQLHGLEINCIRPFNVYGSRQSPRGSYSAVVPSFIKHFKFDFEPWLSGDGKQERDFIHVDDVVEIIYLASKCKRFGEIFNAGSGKSISIKNLLKEFNIIFKMKVKPIYKPKVVEPKQTLADMSKVKRVLNFEPQIGIREGLRRTINESIGPRK
jgi:UDP-glucose 4-epimerase